MRSPRWRKAIRDLWLNKARALLVVLAIAIGVFGAGSVLNTYSVLTRELDVNYLATNPASARLWTEPFGDDLVEAVRSLPEIAEAEGRRRIRARVQVGPDEWRTIWLIVVGDFDDIRVSTFKPEEGAWPPAEGEILIERQALGIAQTSIGETVLVKTPTGVARELRVAGTAYDLGQAPAWMEGWAYGYITLETLGLLGEEPYLDELMIVVAENGLDEVHIWDVANELRDWIERDGRRVYRIHVPAPGKHEHYEQMDSLMFLQASFGFLALLLSGVLVVNMISSLLAQQVRQIGMMKAVGGRTRQIAGVYFGIVLILGLAASAVAIPAGVVAGRAYADFVAGMLNFDIADYTIPPWAFALQVFVDLLMPVVAALYPIYRGSRVTVREAIGDYGIGRGGFGTGSFDRLLGRVRGLARPLLLSIRNTFRRRGRLALTLGTLAVGGAIFLAALNVRASLSRTVEERFVSLNYDIALRFSRPYPAERIEGVIRGIPGVARVEGWGGAQAALVYPDGTNGNHFWFVAPPETSKMVDFAIVGGRWLRPGDENVVVINNQLLDQEPGIGVGDEIVLRIGERETRWRVVGVVLSSFGGPIAYANYGYFAKSTGQVGYAGEARVVTEGHGADSLKDAKRFLERDLREAGLEVVVNDSILDSRQVVDDHLVVITFFLILMSILIVAVGGLGLMSTMSINVLERTREIGVMRAIGASDGAILRIIVIEGAVIGALSWLVALVLAPPISIAVGNALGMMLLQTTLEFAVAPLGLVLWFVVAVLFSAAASFYPAWSATWPTVREVLAYE